MDYKGVIRKICPDYLPVRKFIAKMMKWRFSRHIIKEEDRNIGEKNNNAKQHIVKKYEKKWPKFIREYTKKIDEVTKEITVSSDVRTDMLFCRIGYGFKPEEYLSFKLQNKTINERIQYISDINRLCYDVQMNDPIEYGLLKDKWQSYEKFKLYYKRDAICISNKNDYGKFCDFVDKHKQFVKKRVDLGWGESVSRIKITNETQKKDLFSSLLSEGEIILEEEIVQGNELAILNASSINTVRCASFNTKSGIKIGFCFLRIGQNGSFVDNGSAGGIEVGININTGQLNTDGYDHFGKEYIKHPDSGIIFNGYQLPHWNEMINQCKKMAMLIPRIKYVGWDMAYSNKGWCIVEANGTAQFMGPQICYKRGFKRDIEFLMEDMDLLA